MVFRVFGYIVLWALLGSCAGDGVPSTGPCFVTSLGDGVNPSHIPLYDSLNRVTGWTYDVEVTHYIYNEQWNRIIALVTGTDTTTLDYNADTLMVAMLKKNCCGQSGTYFRYNQFKQLQSAVSFTDGCTNCGMSVEYEYPDNTAKNPSVVRYDGTSVYHREYDNRVNPRSLVFPYDPRIPRNNVIQERFAGLGIPQPIFTYYRYDLNEQGYPLRKYNVSSPQVMEVTTYRCP